MVCDSCVDLLGLLAHLTGKTLRRRHGFWVSPDFHAGGRLLGRRKREILGWDGGDCQSVCELFVEFFSSEGDVEKRDRGIEKKRNVGNGERERETALLLVERGRNGRCWHALVSLVCIISQ